MKNKPLSIVGGVAAIAVFVLTLVTYKSLRSEDVQPSSAWRQLETRGDILIEKVLVQSDGVNLEVVILLPKGGADRKPAVVFSTGSGDNIFQDYAGLAERYVRNIFLPRDIAVVFVNKRGMGQSGGNWKNNDIEGRATDIYSVVAQIKDHENIDPGKVGVMGHSQGGWVVTQAAAQHPDIAFMIDLMGPTTPVYQQVLFQWRQSFTCDGLTQSEVENKLKWKNRMTKIAIKLGSVVHVGMLGFDSKVLPYDPTDMLKNLETPSLFVFGELDALVPGAQNIAHLDDIFSGSVPSNLTAVNIPKINHRGYEVDDICTPLGSTAYGAPSAPMVMAMNDWLDANNL